MINIKPHILQMLKTIPGVTQICHAWPEDFGKLPCITYKIEDNSTHTKTDNIERLSNIRFQIDIWTKSGSENSLIASQIDKKFNEIGFERVFYNDLKDDAFIHGVMKYRGIVDSEINYVYQ